MDTEALKKEIDILINERNHLWNALILTVAGTISLIFSVKTLLIYILIFAGISFAIIFFNGYFNKKDMLQKLLNKLKGGK
ncbi:MAG TPA: hypothetical protein P5556_06995 [Candidatus Gastranaerophilales bacterium]|nr:hypothetical protein [Candidatus Gastranaerophilales bacterium]